MSHQVFISYSSEDKPIAHTVCQGLEQRGVTCWMAPRDIRPGIEYAEGIIDAIEQTQVLVLILTAHSNDSPQVVREVERAVSKRIPILVFRTEEVVLSKAMEYFVSSHHWLDASTSRPEDHVNRLADAVMHHGNGQSRSLSDAASAPSTESLQTPDPQRPSADEKPGPESYLSHLSENEFGGGIELSTTGFLIFGLLTFWLYHVWVYHRTLSRHLRDRWSYFNGLISEDRLPPLARESLSTIKKLGFGVTDRVKHLTSALYLTSILLILGALVAQHLFAIRLITEDSFNAFTIGGTSAAVLCFCSSSVWFLAWVCRSVRNHEYHELLLLKMSRDPMGFKMVKPSDNFVRRWDNRQNWIAFFLILSIPMTLSPAVAVIHVSRVIERGGDFVSLIYLWTALIFALAAVFHLWGTRILLDMYNGHLRTERRQQHELKGRQQ
jgi:hypothetical protein